MTTQPPSTNVTKEGIEVQPGQVWEDMDKRMPNRRVTVISVADGKALCKIGYNGNFTTKLSIRRMHRSSTGWRLVQT